VIIVKGDMEFITKLSNKIMGFKGIEEVKLHLHFWTENKNRSHEMRN